MYVDDTHKPFYTGKIIGSAETESERVGNISCGSYQKDIG